LIVGDNRLSMLSSKAEISKGLGMNLLIPVFLATCLASELADIIIIGRLSVSLFPRKARAISSPHIPEIKKSRIMISG